MTNVRLVSIVLALALAPLFGAAGTALAQDDATCLSCHAAEGLTLTLPSKEMVPATIDPKAFQGSVHGSVLTCTTCHPQNAQYPHPAVTSKTLRDYKKLAAQVCTTCHPDPAAAFAESVHGRALTMGFADVPTCTSCHGAHDVAKALTPTFRNNVPQLCGTCHADPKIMQKYGLRAVYQTYIQEFHGVTTTLYKLTKPYSPTPAAICNDCHGGHDIKAADDPASRVNRANLLTTCRTCHPDAGRYFATAWTEHKTPGPSASPLVFYVQIFYRLLIPAVVGFLGILTVLDLGRWAGDQVKKVSR